MSSRESGSGVDVDTLRAQFLAGALSADSLATSSAKYPVTDSASMQAKGELLALAGDDTGVLALLDVAEEEDIASTARMLHWAGCAAARLDDVAQAKRHWAAAMEADSDYAPPRLNLADFNKPIRERQAPWFFTAEEWFGSAAKAMGQTIQKANNRPDKKSRQRLAKGVLSRFEQIEPMALHALDRGDARTRRLLIDLAELSGSSDLLSALKPFALGQRGTDQMRIRAANLVRDHGLLPSGIHKMWMRGQWGDLMVVNFEIQTTPVRDPATTPEAQALHLEGSEYLVTGQFDKAISVLNEARKLAPNSAHILNNLGIAYEQGGQPAQARALIREIRQRFPDYLFSIFAQANILNEAGKHDEALDLVKPLLSRQKMHITEVNSLCQTMIQIYLAKGLPESADSWLKLWTDVSPDHLSLPRFRLSVMQALRARGH